MKKFIIKNKLLFALIILAALNVFYFAVPRLSSGFAELHYKTLYTFNVNIFGRFFGIFPFPVGEFLLPVLIIALVVFIIVEVVRSIIKKDLHILSFTGKVFLCSILSALLVFQVNCGVNYHRKSRAAFISKQTYSRDELTRAANAILDGLLSCIQEKPDMDFSTDFNDAKIRKEAKRAMEKLYPKRFFPLPKAVVFSDKILTPFMLEGIYNPFTIEANYNSDSHNVSNPFIMCHELSHLAGFMREDEASFNGFLACINSVSAEMRFGGYYTALEYISFPYYNACVGEDGYVSDEYTIWSSKIPELYTTANSEESDYWTEAAETYEDTAQISENVNSSYLETNGVEEGTDNYGLFVNLLLDYYSN